jgi:hypothetical protein
MLCAEHGYEELLQNLVALGILNEEKRGRVALVSVNKKLPYFSEPKALITKTAGLGDLARTALSGHRGIQYALIYGSFASGEESQSSNIDLLIVGDAEEEEVLKATRASQGPPGTWPESSA